MIDLIKADFYRTRKYKSLYVVAVVCMLFSLLSALMFKGLDWAMTTMMTNDMLVGIGGDLSATDLSVLASFGYTSAFDATKGILISDTLIYCLTAIFIIVSGIEFASFTIKNSLMSGIKRSEVYWSKFAVSVFYTICYYLAFWASALLFNALIYWDGFTAKEFLELCFIAVKQIPIYIGIIAAGHCFVFMTQSNVGAIALYIATFMMFNTILPIFNMIVPWEVDITLFFPLYQCIALTEPISKTIEYVIIYGSTFAYIVAFLFVGYRKFNKAEIK